METQRTKWQWKKWNKSGVFMSSGHIYSHRVALREKTQCWQTTSTTHAISIKKRMNAFPWTHNLVQFCYVCRWMQIYSHMWVKLFRQFTQCSPSQGSTLACSLEISPPPSLLPLHHSPRWSPVPLHSVLPLPLGQPSRSIWPTTRVRAKTSLQVIWPRVKPRVRLGGSGSLTDPVSFFFRVPPCQQLSHLSLVFIEGGGGGHFPSALLFFVKYPSTVEAPVSRFPLVRNTLPLPLLQNTTALISWVSKCCSPPLNHPPPPAETSPPPQASPLRENQRGRQEARNCEPETTSLHSTERATLWWRNGTFLAGRSSSLKQKGGVRKQTQEEGEVVREELNCWGSTFYSPKRG